MAYVDQKMSSSRITAIVIVALLHALLGYAFISGLALRVAKQAVQDLKTFDVIEEPPPPEEEPPPPVETPVQVQPPPVVSPPPIVRTNTPPPLVSTVNVAPPSPPITYTAPPAPPSAPVAPPAPPRKVETAKARANLGSYISDDDYPASAIRNEEAGTTGFRLEVGANGRVTNCSVTSSSGSRALDDATCRIMRSRARFTPAKDSAGNPTTDTVSSRITWRFDR